MRDKNITSNSEVREENNNKSIIRLITKIAVLNERIRSIEFGSNREDTCNEIQECIEELQSLVLES